MERLLQREGDGERSLERVLRPGSSERIRDLEEYEKVEIVLLIVFEERSFVERSTTNNQPTTRLSFPKKNFLWAQLFSDFGIEKKNQTSTTRLSYI
jgi:hypothetical protein